jgi:hypothetical protein
LPPRNKPEEEEVLEEPLPERKEKAPKVEKDVEGDV